LKKRLFYCILFCLFLFLVSIVYGYTCSDGTCTESNSCGNQTTPSVCAQQNVAPLNVSCDKSSFYSVCIKGGFNCSNSTGGLYNSSGFEGCGYDGPNAAGTHMCETRNSTIFDCTICAGTDTCSAEDGLCNREFLTKNWYYCTEDGDDGVWNMSEHTEYGFDTPDFFVDSYGERPDMEWGSWGYWDVDLIVKGTDTPDDEHFFYCDNAEIDAWRYGWGTRYCANNVTEASWEAGCPAGWNENKTVVGTLSTEYTTCSWQDGGFATKIEFEISKLGNITELDNTDGNVIVNILDKTGNIFVSRKAAVGMYKVNMSIVMQGEKFNLTYDTDYTYNLSTSYGDYLYNFTTPGVLETANPVSTKMQFEIDSMNFANMNGVENDIVLTISNSTDDIVSRNADNGVYNTNMTIGMIGAKFSLFRNILYTLNISSSNGDFLYNFTLT